MADGGFGQLGAVSVAVVGDLASLKTDFDKAKPMAAKWGLELAGFASKGFSDGFDVKIDIGEAFKSLGGKAKDIGKVLSAGITAPLVGLGTAAIAASMKVDEAFDQIRAGTGKTGAALEGLQNDFKEVAQNVPDDIGTVTTAITELSQRTGLAGKPLQDLATQTLNLARLTKTDLSSAIALTTRVFGDWSVATEDQSRTLDYLYKVSQATGVGIADLSEKVVKFGGPMRALGFDFETATALIGKFEKEGVNTDLVLSSLRIGLGKLAKEGIRDAGAALTVIIDRIKNAGSAAESTAVAMKYFGAKAGPDMALAIREGRFAVDDLKKAIAGSSETINKAAADTLSFADKVTILGNRIAVKLAPLGDTILKAVEGWIPTVERGIDIVGELIDAFASLPGPIQAVGLAGAALAAVAGPALFGIGLIASTVGDAIIGLGGLKVAFNASTLAAQASTIATTAFGVALNAIPWLVIAGSVAYLGTAIYQYRQAALQAQQATDDWAAADDILQKKLAARGVIVERGTKTQQEFHDALHDAAEAAVFFDNASRQAAEGAKKHGTASNDLTAREKELAAALAKANAALDKNKTKLDASAKARKDYAQSVIDSGGSEYYLNKALNEQASLQIRSLINTEKVGTAYRVKVVPAVKDTIDSMEMLGHVYENNAAFQERQAQDEADLFAAREKDQSKFTEHTETLSKKWRDAWSVAVGNITSDFAKGVADMIFEGGKFSLNLKTIFKDLGKSLVEILVTDAFTKIAQGFEDVVLKRIGKAAANWVGLGGEAASQAAGGAVASGSTASAAGSVAGSAASAGGQAASSALTGWISIGLQVAQILTTAFAGRGRQQRTEENTRESRDWLELQTNTWNPLFFADSIHLEQIEGNTRNIGGIVYDVGESLRRALFNIQTVISATSTMRFAVPANASGSTIAAAGGVQVNINSPVFNNSVSPTIEIPASAELDILSIRDQIIPEFLTAMINNNRGAMQALAEQVVNTLRGVTSREAVVGA